MEWEKFYDKAYNWILTVGPRVLIALFILIIGLWLIRIFKGWIQRHMTRKEFDPSVQPFLASLIITVLKVLLVIALMQVVGLQLTVFTTLIGAIGVAAGLALSGTLQNFTSGVLILLLKPFEVGDIIVAQGKEGVVTGIQIFYTVVKTYDNTTVIIPNSKLSNEVILNLSREGIRRLDVELKFNYGFSFDQVSSIISNSIQKEDYTLQSPAPRIGVSSVDPDGFKIQISVWIKAHDYQDKKLLFQEALVNDLKAAGLKLPGM